VRRFEIALPSSVDDCLQILAGRGADAKLVAGGTDLLPQLKNGLLKPGWVVDLSGVSRLRTLEGDGGRGLRIGAAVTARELELHPAVKSGYRALAESGALVGSVQVRNLATLGGNVCNAAPSADMIPPLLALDAEAVIAGPKGERRVPLTSFFLGVRRTVLGPDELLLEIAVPAPGPRSGGNYLRHTPRRELDIAVVGVAAQLTLSNGVCAKARIALAAVAPVPLRATRPISDQRGSLEFRRHLVRVLTRRTLTTALERAGV